MSEFRMPSLGADMESGKVVQWLVQPGSRIRKGDVIAVVETHKGSIDVEIFEEGVIDALVAAEGEEVPVGGVIARLTTLREAREQPPAVAPVPVPAPVAQEAPPPPPVAAPASGARVKVSPAARRRAAELGLHPETLHGSGVDGAVTLADVEAALPVRAADAAPTARARRGFDPDQMRKGIAAAMSRSNREIPHYYLTTTIDMSAAQAWLAEYNAVRDPGDRLLAAVLYLRAAALALKEVPQLNGFWENDAFRPAEAIHIGWAISLRGGGLMAPAIRDVDALSIAGLMRALKDLIARARGGGLRSSEMTDATFTITSLGERGAESVGGIIYPPQVALLGLGSVVERPWVVGGAVAPRPLVTASLAADHRASDGHVGGRFLSSFARFMQEPPES